MTGLTAEITPILFCKTLINNYTPFPWYNWCNYRNNETYIYLEKLGKVPSAAAYGIRIVKFRAVSPGI